MKAVTILVAVVIYFQWISSSPVTNPITEATPQLETCQTHEIYDPISYNSTSAYAFCKNLILPPEKQLSITASPDNIKYIVFKNNILPLIPLGTFDSFSKLTHLYLNDNGVKTLIPGLFTYATQLQELYLQDNSITEISTGTFNTLANLAVLDLSGNAIMNLGRDCLTGLVNLESLNLNRNTLHYLEREAFVSLTALEILDLSHNCLSMSGPFFAIEIEAKNLRKLLINNNLLVHFSIIHTGNLNLLELLDASFNNLTKIDFDLIPDSIITNFSNNQISVVTGRPKFNDARVIDFRSNKINYSVQINGEIERLDLDWNELKLLDILLNNPAQLQELAFAHNFINEIANNFFQNLTNLQTLNLNNNRLTYLRIDCFVGLDSLDLLSLSHNSLRILQDGVFNGLSELTTLYLDYNKLISINENAFLGLYNLRRLYLNNNLLTTINLPSLLEHLPNLNTIFLSNNNWSCNELLSITETFKTHLMKLSEQRSFDISKLFQIACDNIHLKVYSHKDGHENLVQFLFKAVSSLMLFFVLTIDVVMVTWYFVYLKITLQQSKMRLKKFEHILTKIRTKNREDVYYTIL